MSLLTPESLCKHQPHLLPVRPPHRLSLLCGSYLPFKVPPPGSPACLLLPFRMDGPLPSLAPVPPCLNHTHLTVSFPRASALPMSRAFPTWPAPPAGLCMSQKVRDELGSHHEDSAGPQSDFGEHQFLHSLCFSDPSRDPLPTTSLSRRPSPLSKGRLPAGMNASPWKPLIVKSRCLFWWHPSPLSR